MKKILLIIITLHLSATHAMADINLYSGEVFVASQGEADRQAAIPDALIQVLQKLSGQREMPTSPALDDTLKDANRFLRSYRYTRVDRTAADGDVTQELRLVAQFMQPEIDRIFQQVGLPRWRQERPEVQVWVVVDDGLNRQLKPLEFGYAWESVEQISAIRGLPISWPELDEEEVQLVDMREEYRRHQLTSPLSSRLADELRACVERGEQALVLRNRRGWASAVLCPKCGERLSCRRCSVAMTWHRSQRRLRCHYCGGEGGVCELGLSRKQTLGTSILTMIVLALVANTGQVDEPIRALLPLQRVEDGVLEVKELLESGEVDPDDIRCSNLAYLNECGFHGSVPDFSPQVATPAPADKKSVAS